MKYITTIQDQEFVIEIDQEGQITVNGQEHSIDFQELGDSGIFSLLLNHQSLEALVEEREGSGWEVLIHGELYSASVQDERSYRLAKARGAPAEVVGDVTVRSPMPGLIIAVPVQVGQRVKKGNRIVILESMKMENELHSPRNGIVTHVLIQEGASVEKGQALVSIGDAPVVAGEAPVNE